MAQDQGVRSGLRLGQFPRHRLQGDAGDRGRDQPAPRRGRTARTDIPLTNFRGIELRDFPAEIARLALIIAEYQCDVLYRGQKEALAEFLPLDAENWITCGNALRLDWLSICPPTGTGVKLQADDLFHTPLDQAQIDFENEGGETYICGNPPYLGGKWQSQQQKSELASVFGSRGNFGELDYVAGWIVKAAKFALETDTKIGFVVTNSINQGAQVHQLWPEIYSFGIEIMFAHKDIKWSNSASNNAAVICSIIGLQVRSALPKRLFVDGFCRIVDSIGPYLVPSTEVIVLQSLSSLSGLTPMITGNSPYDGGHLIISSDEKRSLNDRFPETSKIIRPLVGSQDYLNGRIRFCLWMSKEDVSEFTENLEIAARIERVKKFREGGGEVARGLSARPYSFRYTHEAKQSVIVVPRVSSERRQYIPFGFLSAEVIISDSAQAIYDPDIWILSLLLSRASHVVG